jgi:hypothetical protein
MNFQSKVNRLTKRECEVLVLFAEGLATEEIAKKLVIEKSSVRSHLHHIYTKLDLLDLPPRVRVFALRDDYSQLAREALRDAKPDPKVEILDPVPVEVDAVIDQDENSIKALVVTTPPPVSPMSRRGISIPCFGMILLGLAGVTAIWLFLLGGAQAAQALLASPTPSSTATFTPPATYTPSSTNAVTETLTPTGTFTATSTPTETVTSSPRSTATLALGPVYELGDWHKEGDLWFRLFSYEVDWEGIYVLVEMWNRSSQTVYFHWETMQNTFLRDNQGNRYEIDSRFEFKDDDEIVPANTRKFIGAAPYDDQWTNWFDPEYLFSQGVTDLFFTLEYFSVIEKATWRIPVGN